MLITNCIPHQAIVAISPMQAARAVRAVAAGKGRAAAGLSQCMTSEQAYALLDAEDSARASESRALPPPPAIPHGRRSRGDRKRSEEIKRDQARPSEITRPSELPISPPAAATADALPSPPTSSIAATDALPSPPTSSIAATDALPSPPTSSIAAADALPSPPSSSIAAADALPSPAAAASAREEFGRFAEAVTAGIEDLALTKGSSSRGLK